MTPDTEHEWYDNGPRWEAVKGLFRAVYAQRIPWWKQWLT